VIQYAWTISSRACRITKRSPNASRTRQIRCSYISLEYPPQVRANSILRISRDRVSRISSASSRANSVPRRIITYTLDVMMRRVAAESPSSSSPSTPLAVRRPPARPRVAVIVPFPPSNVIPHRFLCIALLSPGSELQFENNCSRYDHVITLRTLTLTIFAALLALAVTESGTRNETLTRDGSSNETEPP